MIDADDLADELLRRPADVRRAAEALAALASVPPFMRRGYPLEAGRMARRAALAVAELIAQKPGKKSGARTSAVRWPLIE